MANKTKKLRPCDCPDKLTAEQLETQGIDIGGFSITVEPLMVVLQFGTTTIKIPMSAFKRMIEWYLEPQETLSERLWTTEDYENIPDGSCIHVKSRTKTTYTGICSFSGGSYPVTVPKTICSKTSTMDRVKETIHKKYVEGQK